jgi:hypothetical protein
MTVVKMYVPVSVSLAYCALPDVPDREFAQFIAMVTSGEIRIVPDAPLTDEQVPDARPY